MLSKKYWFGIYSFTYTFNVLVDHRDPPQHWPLYPPLFRLPFRGNELSNHLCLLLFCWLSNFEYTNTIDWRAVDRSTIQFWNFLAEGHTTYKASNFYFISLLKDLGSATNRDSLLLVTLRYLSLRSFP